MKTNATRILDKLGIAYETRSYDVDPDDLGAEKVALGIGISIERVFKTLVARGEQNGVLLAVAPGDAEVGTHFRFQLRIFCDRFLSRKHINNVSHQSPSKNRSRC